MSITPPGSRARKPRGLTPGQFAKLLVSLASDREAAAEHYEEIRRALITFFEFHPTGFHPNDEADEVINRVARRLDEGARFTRQIRAIIFMPSRVTFGANAARVPSTKSRWKIKQFPANTNPALRCN